MTKKAAKSKDCECVDQVNAQLAEHGVRLESRVRIEFGADAEAGALSSCAPIISTEWIDKPKRGKKLPPVLCSYCPFCGKEKP